MTTMTTVVREVWLGASVTLIVLAASDDYVVQLSDRRLSRPDARPLPVEQAKGAILESPWARLCIGFSGLAQAGQFKTQRWILETLSEVGKAGDARRVIDAFVRQANHDFKSLPELRRMPSRDRRVSFVLSGYAPRADGATTFVSSLVSNFQNWETGSDLDQAEDVFFQHNTWEPDDRQEGMAYVQRIGRWSTFPPDLVNERLRPLLEAGKPSEAVVDVAVAMVREVAGRDATVGKDITAITLRRDGSYFAEYHSSTVANTIFMPDLVQIDRQGHARALSDARISMVSAGGPPMAVPKVGRNVPCPCGSGVKYKRCHGQSRPASPPPTIVVEDEG